ncbi:hypothetical protein [Streptomyces sp. NPDC051109]|uniref:hypothetical protein n=1 Tax=Streptomyces sp. NPDC051109 TaxID=3365642 RepID=UPI0037AEAE68
MLVRVHGGRELATVLHGHPHAVIERESAGAGRPATGGRAATPSRTTARTGET